MNINFLKDIVEDIITIYENLNRLADTKTIILKENDINTLDQIMQKEEVYYKKIVQLLKSGEDFVNEFGQFNEIENKEIETVMIKLRNVSSIFSKKNEINQSLVQQSLYYVNMNINMLTPKHDSDTYSPQNKKSSKKPNRVFMDSRV